MENRLTISSDLIRGHIDTIILHSLLGGDKFAQQISDAVEQKSSGEYKINQATLYSSLKRLESLKLVSSYWFDYSDGRRKYFKITDSGKQTVEDNLSSWAYSRSIIDKLMDLQPVQVFNLPKNDVISDSKPVTVQPVILQTPEKAEELQPLSEKIADMESREEHEINFRNILNGLIQIASSSKSEAEEKTPHNPLKPIVKDDLPHESTEKPDVMKFNETIAETDYNANSSNYNGKIDYGDLTLKAKKEGYVIKISSKDSAKPVGKTLINKLNFVSYLMLFILIVAEFGLLSAVFSGVYSSPLIITLAALSILPILAFGAAYFTAKEKLSKKTISADGILIAAIAAFNLILITLAIDFLFEIDFYDKHTVFAALVIPIMYYLDFVAFFIFRFILSRRKSFKLR